VHKPNVLAKDLELMMECKTNSYPKQCMMRFSEVHLGDMMCFRPNALAKDLELMMECTMSSYPKQCMMRFSEVYLMSFISASVVNHDITKVMGQY
jgi:hypothetical protein